MIKLRLAENIFEIRPYVNQIAGMFGLKLRLVVLLKLFLQNKACTSVMRPTLLTLNSSVLQSARLSFHWLIFRFTVAVTRLQTISVDGHCRMQMVDLCIDIGRTYTLIIIISAYPLIVLQTRNTTAKLLFRPLTICVVMGCV